MNFLDADRLAGKDGAEVNLFVPETDASAIGNHDELVVEGIIDVGQPLVSAGGGLIDPGREPPPWWNRATGGPRIAACPSCPCPLLTRPKQCN